MRDDSIEWNFDDDFPIWVGWYPVVICYDPAECVMVSRAYYDGRVWNQDYVVAFGPVRDTEGEAAQWAHENDPDRVK